MAQSKNSLWILLAIILLAACTPAEPSPTPTDVPTCGGYVIPDEALTCIEQPDGILLQTPTGAQSVLALNDGTLTLTGTVYIAQNEQALTLTVITLEGTAVIGARGSTRIMSAGSQVIISLNEAGQISNISNQPLPVDTDLMNRVNRSRLPRAIGTFVPIAAPSGNTLTLPGQPTPTPIDPTLLARGTPVSRATVCAPRDDWVASYTVRSGDTLSRIGANYGITALQIQTGNCLTNPNRLNPGDVIRLPMLPTITPFAAPTLTPSAIAFRADIDTLNAGDCTVIRWDVFNVSAVFFDEEATASSNVRQVCPSTTTLYSLRVVYPDGTQTTQTLTVTVR